MKRLSGLLVLGFLLALGLIACGDALTSTPAAATVAPTIAPTIAPAPAPTAAPVATPTVGNSILATITAASGTSGPTTAPIPTRAPSPTPVITNDLPVYSGLKPLNLGILGKQVADSIGQAGPTARSVTYSTTDSFDKLAAFYNAEMTKVGYSKVAEQPLPASVGLAGSVLLYAKGTGTAANVVAVMALGPLEAEVVTSFLQVAPEASSLKAGDSVVIVLSGLTGTNLLELQKSLGTTSAPTASPTK